MKPLGASCVNTVVESLHKSRAPDQHALMTRYRKLILCAQDSAQYVEVWTKEILLYLRTHNLHPSSTSSTPHSPHTHTPLSAFLTVHTHTPHSLHPSLYTHTPHPSLYTHAPLSTSLTLHTCTTLHIPHSTHTPHSTQLNMIFLSSLMTKSHSPRTSPLASTKMLWHAGSEECQ